MPRKAKGKVLSLFPVRIDEDVKAALIGFKSKGINEGLREVLGLNAAAYTTEKIKANLRPKSVLRDRPRLLKPKEKK
jgi:hypothetical protein